ncbi:MurR/RpiR family transcriptional regulator [Pseudogemmobacter sonorensis]|uniref:MurR/RpiR family transcriptional regulator n=1 Tax=Pseudogemmobacter sonorensis TaxID=2989681 RepID=UPI003683F687
MTDDTSPAATGRFLDLVRAALPDLHPAERRLGQFLFDFPGEISSYDAQELARLAGVSKATVSRFVRRLGFPSYEEARRAAREEGRTGSRLYLGHAADGGGLDMTTQIEEERANLEWTFRRISPESLDRLAGAILSARRVWVIGHRISASFASYLSWQLVKLVDDIVTVPQAGESMGEHIARIRPDDLVLHFALRRRAAGTDRIIEEIARTGAAIALITDEGVVPRDDLGWHFLCQTGTRSAQFNHGAVLALCHQIMIRTSAAAGAQARMRLRRIEALNEALGDL